MSSNIKLTRQDLSSYSLLISVQLIVFVGLLFILPTLGFFLHIKMNSFYFFASFFISIAFTFYYNKISLKLKQLQFLLVQFGVVFLILFSVVVAKSFFDYSFDGQKYHQGTFIKLKDQWNPVYDSLNNCDETFNENEHPINNLWINHYPKSVEVSQSSFYFLFDKIESGKAINILAYLMSLLLVFSMLINLTNFSIIISLLTSFAISSNPIVLLQIFTYNIDGVMYSFFVCVIAFVILNIKKYSRLNMIILGLLIIYFLNIKFTTFVFSFILMFFVLLFLLYNRKFNLLKTFVISSIFSFSLGIFVMGFHPYITNTINHEHPFYPFKPKMVVDVFEHNKPFSLVHRNRFENFFISIFSKSIDVVQDENLHLKPPFYLYEVEKKLYYQTRFAGLGPFFSGAFVLSLLLFSFLLIRKNFITFDKALVVNSLIVLGFFITSIFIVKECWWFRYIPQLWLLPISVFIVTEMYSIYKFTGRILFFIIIVNIAFVSFYHTEQVYARNKIIVSELNYIKQLEEPVSVDFGVFTPISVRFDEHNIKYNRVLIPENSSDDISKISFTRVRYINK
jgi:hypothetical protein